MANQSGGGGGSSIPTPVSTANGGTGANNSAATGFQQYNSGVGSVAPLSAADIPTGVDAGKLIVPAAAHLPAEQNILRGLKSSASALSLACEKISVTGISALGSNANARTDAVDTSKYNAVTWVYASDQITAASTGLKPFVSITGAQYTQVSGQTALTVAGRIAQIAVGNAICCPPLMKLDVTNGATAQGVAPVIRALGFTAIYKAPSTIVQPTKLTNGQTYTLGPIDLGAGGAGVHFPKIFGINIQSDRQSATNGVSHEFSDDGTNWYVWTTDTMPNAGIVQRAITTYMRYYRMVYTNSTSTQTVFDIQYCIGDAS